MCPFKQKISLPHGNLIGALMLIWRAGLRRFEVKRECSEQWKGLSFLNGTSAYIFERSKCIWWNMQLLGRSPFVKNIVHIFTNLTVGPGTSVVGIWLYFHFLIHWKNQDFTHVAIFLLSNDICHSVPNSKDRVVKFVSSFDIVHETSSFFMAVSLSILLHTMVYKIHLWPNKF